MAVVRATRDGRLRLGGVGGAYDVEGRAGGPNAGIKSVIRRKPGVLEFRDIPAGLTVMARVDWPGGLVPSGADLASIDVGGRAVGSTPAGTPVSYRFEHGAPPNATLPGGAVVPRTGKRFIIPSAAAPFGPVTYVQVVPSYVSAASGTLYQQGKAEHSFAMPGLAAGERQEWLRFRWVGTTVAGAVLLVAAGETVVQDITWASGHRDLAPGSIVMTLPTSAGVLRDDGHGRIVGEDGDGLVDYQTGAFYLRFRVAETGNVTVNYEHSCPYSPLDACIEWDALMAQ